jgi:hypothetical protein
MDLKSNAYKNLQNAYTLFRKDLDALPGDVFDKKFGDKTRTVADIVYEVTLLNDHVEMGMCGKEAPAWPEDGWMKAPEDFRTKEAILKAFDKSSEHILATIEGFSPEEVEELVPTNYGDRTRFSRCQFMTLHLWYHSGQLNYIQTLLGDDGWHW